MTEQNKPGRAPDYKGDGVAVWINTSKEGKQYLTINLLGSIRVAAFKNEPRKIEEVNMS